MITNNKPNWKAAFFTRCPNCGRGRIFSGLIKLSKSCDNCGLELTTFETADGPAFFAITIIGAIVGIAAGIVEVIYSPPLWVHFALWIPTTIIGSSIIIRITKALMIAHQLKLKSTDFFSGLYALEGLKIETDYETKKLENTAWRGAHPGTDFLCVITPDSPERLPALFEYCAKHNIKIVPRSGGTALTGGSVIDPKLRSKGSYIILKLYDKNKITSPEIIDNGALVKVYPGNTTKVLNALLAPSNRVVTVDLGIGDKAGAAQILGYLATDAAGSGAAFKGRAIDIIHSMRVIIPNGKIYDLPDNSSPDAPKIEDIAGMGGTTGIILDATIKTGELPQTRQVAAVRIKNIGEMYDLLDAFKQSCWKNVNLFERMNAELFNQVIEYKSRQNDADTKLIQALGAGDIMFVELTSTNPTENLTNPLHESLAKAGLLNSSIIAKTPQQAESFLAYRVVNASKACEDYAEKTGGEVIAFDISAPPGDVSEFPSAELIQTLRDEIPAIKIFNFGHAAGVEKISASSPCGGTATHFNPVVPPGTSDQDIAFIRHQVFAEVSARGGKIVSEHTPGAKLVHYLKEFQPDLYQTYLTRIAKWNPNGVLNPDVYVTLSDLLEQVKTNKKTPG